MSMLLFNSGCYTYQFKISNLERSLQFIALIHCTNKDLRVNGQTRYCSRGSDSPVNTGLHFQDRTWFDGLRNCTIFGEESHLGLKRREILLWDIHKIFLVSNGFMPTMAVL